MEVWSQRYFELKSQELVDEGRSKIVYAKGSRRFLDHALSYALSLSAVTVGIIGGAAIGIALGLEINEVFGKGLLRPWLSSGPGTIFFPAILMVIGGMIGRAHV